MPREATARTPRGHDAGFTLIELLVVMVIAGVVMSIGAMSFANWRTQSQHQGSADRLVSEFRKASVLAVSEGRTHCVEIKATQQSSQLWRKSCGGPLSATIGGSAAVQGSHPTLDASAVPAATTLTPCPSGSKCVYFFPRGTATAANVTVRSSQRGKTYVVNVEGLTSRVYL